MSRAARSLGVLAVTLSLLTLPLVPVVGHAQGSGAETVAKAAQLYDQSQFEEAIRVVNEAIAKHELSGADLQNGQQIVARSQVKLGRRLEAQQTFKAILRSDQGYRLDPVRTPPDELEVFNLAYKEFQAELVEQGKRIPTSLGGYAGYGTYALDEFNEQVVEGEGDEITGGFEFGGGVRIPIRPRWSLDFELGRIEGKTEDADGNELKAVGMPLVVGVAWNFWSRPRLRASAILGAGPLLSSGAEIVGFLGSQLKLSITKTGFYSHAGLESEYLLFPRYSITVRALGRYAKTNDLGDSDSAFDADFTGFAIHGGVRAYVGY